MFFHEAEILLGKGYPEKALKIYRAVINLKTDPGVWYKIGEIEYQLTRFSEARIAFENAISMESDRAKYHRAIAETLIHLGEYEEAVEYAFTSIELVKHYPAAHFVLGRALEKMGDLENAKLAYETAERLRPQNHERTKIARENIEELLALPKDHKGEQQFRYRKGQIVIVSGLPRSGTSLMMQMLSKGGSTIVTDQNRKADESNPKGYFEYDPVMNIHKDNTWLEIAKNKSIKIVAPLLKYLDTQYRYKIIFMTRDLNEVIKSQQVMKGKDPNTLSLKLLESYHQLLKTVDIWQNSEPGVELIYVDYKDALAKPSLVIDRIVNFIGEDLDKDAMMTCIDKTLYRNRA